MTVAVFKLGYEGLVGRYFVRAKSQVSTGPSMTSSISLSLFGVLNINLTDVFANALTS